MRQINTLIRIIFTYLIFSVLIPVVFEYGIFRNNFISVIENKDWAACLGSYVGGALGGVGTMAAVYATLRQNKIDFEKQQLARKAEIEHQDRIAFCNDIATLVGKYSAAFSKFRYEVNHKTRNPEFINYPISRYECVEIYFILDTKLYNIPAAESLMKHLNYLHHDLYEQNYTDPDALEEATKNFRKVAKKFIDDYTAIK